MSTFDWYAAIFGEEGPFLLASIADYERWKGSKDQPAGATVTKIGASTVLLWPLGPDEVVDVGIDGEDPRAEIILLRSDSGVEDRQRNNKASDFLTKKAVERPVGTITLDVGFVAAIASADAGSLRHRPSKLMSQRVGGRHLSALATKKGDEDVGNVFRAKSGPWSVVECSAGGQTWLRLRATANAETAAPAPTKPTEKATKKGSSKAAASKPTKKKVGAKTTARKKALARRAPARKPAAKEKTPAGKAPARRPAAKQETSRPKKTNPSAGKKTKKRS